MLDLDKLQKDVSDLNDLLQDRQEGISSWCLFVFKKWQSIADAWDKTVDTECKCDFPAVVITTGVCRACGKTARR